MRESDIEAQLVRRAKEEGGEVRKVRWTGRRGAPDRVLMLPAQRMDARHVLPRPARTVWVELKATGVAPEDYQLREHARMRLAGQRVEVVDSFDRIEAILR